MKKIISRFWVVFCLILILTVLRSNNSFGQCFFNCNDTVNVSVNAMCMATITPDLMLEGIDVSATSCEYAIQIFREDGVTVFPGVDVGMSEIGLTLKVKVFENGLPNGASCWGYINIEDKLPPELICAGNDTLPCFQLDPYYTNVLAAAELKRRIQVDLVDNCGDQDIDILIIENDLDRQYCMDSISARRIITYEVYDNDRSVLRCMDTISYSQIPLDTLTGPIRRILECTEPYPSVGYMLNRFGESSVPNFNGTALSEYIDSAFVEKERILCNFKMTYTDIEFPTCGNTYKVVREWTVIDWCNSNTPRVINQIIKIEDNSIVIASGCSNISNQVANPETCTANVVLPVPTVRDDECSEWTFAVFIKEPGAEDFVLFGSAVRNSNSNAINRAFPIGVSMVKYVLKDACDNETECTYTVTVVDEEPPTAICDYRSVVTLTDSYTGKLFAKTIDDGSYDDCSGIMSYKVRRTDSESTECPTPSDYDDFVKFCCADIGKIVFVELQVTDSTGMISVCIAEVMVQFKGPAPNVVCAPDPTPQSCDLYNTYDINSLTPPTIMSDNPCLADNLTPEVQEVARSIDSCGNGYIDVEWTINLTGVLEIICSNRITFQNIDIFTREDITWPADRIITTCNDIEPTTAELQNIIPSNLTCSNVVASEPIDNVEDGSGSACFRIIRTWTVVDWCRYPADRSARWTYEQVLTIVNSDGPVIDSIASAINFIDDQNNCRTQIEVMGQASDDCTPEEELVWSYKVTSEQVDIIPLTPGREFTRILPFGDYTLTLFVTDGCDNTSMRMESFSITDSQAPVMQCQVAELQIGDITKDAVVTILDINNESFDNCDPVIDFGMRKAGSSDAFTPAIRFDCQELGITQIELMGTDDSGNTANCFTAVNITNTDDQCGLGSSAIGVSGIILTSDGVAVENVQVGLKEMPATIGIEQMTNIDGEYTFPVLVGDKTYRLNGEKNDDYLNGISTLDIILLQHHILGLRTLNTAEKYLAADINNNRSISSTDIVLLRRLLLGQISSFPDQGSWIFVDPNAEMQDIRSPWDIPQYIDINSETSNNRLKGIKIGDLDQNAIANSALSGGRSVKPYALIMNTISEGSQTIVEIKATEAMKIYGLQFGIEFDSDQLELNQVRSAELHIEEGMEEINLSDYRLTYSATKKISVVAGDNLLVLTFDNISKTESIPAIKLLSRSVFANEIYDENFIGFPMHIIQAQKDENRVELYQNKPNPFTVHTLIEFSLSEQQQVAFTLYDVNGSAVFGFEEIFVSGKNQISISKEGLNLNKGIYYYQIKTQERSLIKKMIIL